MNNYRKAVWAIRALVAVITSPFWIPILIIASPFAIYKWLVDKAEEIEHEERWRFLREEQNKSESEGVKLYNAF